MDRNAQDQLQTAGEPALLAGQHALNAVYGLPGNSTGEAASTASSGMLHPGSASIYGSAAGLGDADLHTPTPTREIPNPLANLAPTSTFSGVLPGYPAAPAVTSSGAFQAQTAMPPAPSIHQHRSTPSLASIASTASTNASSLQNYSQASSPASVGSSPSAVAGITHGQAGLSLASTMSSGQATPAAVPNATFTFSQPMPLHVSTAIPSATLNQPRTPSSASNGSNNSSNGSNGVQQHAYPNQQVMQNIAIAGNGSAPSSNPTTPMPQYQQPMYPVLQDHAQATQPQVQQAPQQALSAPIALEAPRWESGAELALRAAEDVRSYWIV